MSLLEAIKKIEIVILGVSSISDKPKTIGKNTGKVIGRNIGKGIGKNIV